MRTTLPALFAIALCLAAAPADAAETQQTYRWALNEWHELDSSDGPVTLYRIRLNPREGRVTRGAAFRPFNSEYISTLQIQLEYTNESDRRWRARVEVRWLDSEGRVIDGFSGNETLSKKSARKITEMSVPTLKYGLEVAETLEVEINYEP